MNTQKILIVGAGGIGGLLCDLTSRALAFSGQDEQQTTPNVQLTIMDSDIVEEHNLPHQRFTANDVGKPKVEVIVNSLHNVGVTEDSGVELIPLTEDLTDSTNLSIYDLVVVAVDRDSPRKQVPQNAAHWVDLRARGDGFVIWNSRDDYHILDALPKLPANTSASCQLEGAIETSNIQFGFALAAAHGAQGVVQWLRDSTSPPGRIYSTYMGELPFPEVTV